jgi:hypothetical protein
VASTRTVNPLIVTDLGPDQSWLPVYGNSRNRHPGAVTGTFFHGFPPPAAEYDPARRMTDLVISQGFPAEFWPDSELAKLAGNDNLAWWIAGSLPRRRAGC